MVEVNHYEETLLINLLRNNFLLRLSQFLKLSASNLDQEYNRLIF